ncbi:MAG: nicotinamide riboside transporter PnuC [Bacteroidota bacterium]
MQTIFNWILLNYIELIGSVLGIMYVILATRENSWCWLLGILNVLIYIYVFFKAGIFGNMSLQVVYLIISFYGWYLWVRGSNKEGVAISRISTKVFIWCAILILVIFLGVYFLLDNINPSVTTHLLDAITTSLGLIGTWLQARKILENWLLWIFADILSVILYLTQGLYPTTVFYFIMILLAINGYFVWKKQLIKSIALP